VNWKAHVPVSVTELMQDIRKESGKASMPTVKKLIIAHAAKPDNQKASVKSEQHKKPQKRIVHQTHIVPTPAPKRKVINLAALYSDVPQPTPLPIGAADDDDFCVSN
jgi:hypothetical protein